MAKRAARRARPGKDVAIVLDRTEDRRGLQVLRRRGDDDSVEVGTVRPLEEGKPIEGEVVSLKPRADVPFVFDVKTHLPAPAPRPTADGPAQVATPAYRRGWDEIWGALPSPSAGDKPN
jgi:hypothetical protein